MNRVAFSIFGVSIAWYGIIITSAIVIATFLTVKIAGRRGYKSDDIIDIALCAIPLAIVGARLYYVAFNLPYYLADPVKILMIREGGLAIHGGVLGGVLGGYICCRAKKLHVADLLDIVSMPLILAQAIGRWGNFTNGEAHGGPTDLPWAIEVGGEMVHPTFLYESIWNLICFGILVFMYRRRKNYGEIFLYYMALYSAGRFFIEGLRTDSLMFFGLRTAQIVSVLLIVSSGILLYFIKRDPKTRIG